MARVLLADSQPLFNEALEALFSRDDVHQVIGRCSSAEDAFTAVSSLRPDLVLVDAALGLEGSPNLVARMLEACPEARVIVLGDDHDADLLLAAIAPAPPAWWARPTAPAPCCGSPGRCSPARGGPPEHAARAGPPHGIQGPGTRLAAVAPVPPRAPGARPAPEAGTTPASGGTCSSASTPSAPTSRTSLRKLGMHSKLEAATFAMQRSMELELTPGGARTDH